MHRYYAECKKRASLVPAAAVIPALRAYIKVVAFKTPVVEIAWWGKRGSPGKGTGEKEKGGVRRAMHTLSSGMPGNRARRERSGGRAREGKVCALLLGHSQPLSRCKTSPLWNFPLLGSCTVSVRVWSASFSGLLLPSSLGPPFTPLVFCYHKEIGVSIAGRALVAQAPVHCSME